MRAILSADQFNVRYTMITVITGIVMVSWGCRLCYFGFRKLPAPGIILTDDPKLGKSAYRLYGIGMLVGGVIAISSEMYVGIGK